MSGTEFSRRRFLTAAAAAGVAAVGAGSGAAVADTTRGGLAHRGVVYTVGAGKTPGTAWSTARMAADLRAIAQDLHADAIEVTGDGVERLAATASEAAERGLHVWLQPTLAGQSPDAVLDHLAEAGRHAEQLRRQGARIDLSVGCELWLFVPGIVPGAEPRERIENVKNGTVDWNTMSARLQDFTARAASVGRSVFGGRLSYAAAQSEIDGVDWSLFDIVGVDYYSHLPTRADYVRELQSYRRPGKPLAICEFGTCAYVGAPDSDGMAWDIIDDRKTPPEIVGNLVRSEQTQATYLLDLLGAFESMDLYAAMAFEFVTPDQPYLSDPRHDLDLASHSLVKTIKDHPADPASPWHWEPKQAFHALATAYGA